MTTSGSERRSGTGPYRLSDQERDEAVAALGEAYAQGRLDLTEFRRRMTSATRAVLASDLDPLFEDLPRPAPIGRNPTSAARAPAQRRRSPAPAWPPAAGRVLVLLPLVALLVVAAAMHLWVILVAVWLWAATGRSRWGHRPGVSLACWHGEEDAQRRCRAIGQVRRQWPAHEQGSVRG